MRDTTISQFFDFDLHFKEFIKRNSYFNNVNKAYFVIFNDNSAQINYKYQYNFRDNISVTMIRNMVVESEILENDNNSEIRKVNNSFFECENNIYMVNVLNPVSGNKELLGSFIVCTDTPPSYRSENNSINIPYFMQIVYHIETVLSNYEKVYYIVDTFTEIMTVKDSIMPYHMTSVASNCVDLSILLELKPKDQVVLYFSALLHDVGKLFITEDIINKKEELTKEEQNIFKTHSKKGEDILKTILYGMTLFDDIPRIVRHHHENYDGTGYPDELAGDNIPYLSRILTVADAVDKISSKTVYKSKNNIDNIIKELKDKSGKEFDPSIVKAMIKILITDREYLQDENTGNTVYIPQCSFGFYYIDKSNIKSLTGNLILKNNSGTFVIHDFDNTIYAINAMINCTISFFRNGEILEYKVTVKKYYNGKLYFENVKFMPTDSIFSMVWNNTATIYNEELNKKDEVRIIKLGGDTVVFTVDKSNDLALQLINNSKGNYQIHIKEEVDNLVLDASFNIKIVKHYLGYGYTFICRYMNIQSGQKDLLIRLLFRKQMENRKWKAKMLDE